MIRLAEKYADRPAAELPLLFQRILSNATMDWFRRQKVRNAVVQQLLGLRSRRRRRRFRPPRNSGGARTARSQSESAADSVSRAQILHVDRGRDRAAAGPSTRGLPAALLGGTRRRRDGRRRWAAPKAASRRTARGPCMPWQGPEGEGNHDMNQNDCTHRRQPPATRSQARFARGVAARLNESAETRRRPTSPSACASRASRRWSARRARADRRAPPSASPPRARRIARLRRLALVAALASVLPAGRAGRRPGPDPDWQTTARRSRSPPRSTRRCSATTCRSTPIATPASRSS